MNIYVQVYVCVPNQNRGQLIFSKPLWIKTSNRSLTKYQFYWAHVLLPTTSKILHLPIIFLYNLVFISKIAGRMSFVIVFYFNWKKGLQVIYILLLKEYTENCAFFQQNGYSFWRSFKDHYIGWFFAIRQTMGTFCRGRGRLCHFVKISFRLYSIIQI